jgi:hypothetical protein
VPSPRNGRLFSRENRVYMVQGLVKLIFNYTRRIGMTECMQGWITSVSLIGIDKKVTVA